MTSWQTKAVELVNALIPNYKKLEFSATIGDTSRSIEFSVLVETKLQQCYALADAGTIDEKIMEKLFDAYAEYLRSTDQYKKGEVNRFIFSIEK